MPSISDLTKLLASGRDNALIRLSLGNEYLKSGDADAAIEHLRRALEHDPSYSAAWKSLGRAYEVAGKREQALDTYRQGIAAAEKRGDKQAAKEMTVFARRLEKQIGPGTSA
jgi:Tfp pilus assembly protein PilF